MLAITTYLHYVRLLGILAVLATILAIFFRRAIASRMRAFVFLVVWHNYYPAFLLYRAVGTILKLKVLVVKDET